MPVVISSSLRSHRAGFANQPSGKHSEDGLQLKDVLITAICRCVPPKNRPKVAEIKKCLPWMEAEISLLSDLQGFVALGRIAFEGIQRMYKGQGAALPSMDFGHNHLYNLGEGRPWLLTSYHPSQQNTLTGRLTQPMFDEIWRRVKEMIT